MFRRLAASLLICLWAGSVFASDPYSDGEILLKASPGAISVSADYECTIQDQRLAVLIPSQGSIRWVREFMPGSGNHFVIRPHDPDTRSTLLGQLGALACIEHAEPNYTLTLDSDPSNPLDFYFQEEFWPYPPMSSIPTGLFYPDQNYPTCDHLGNSSWPYPTQEDHFELPDQWHLQLTQTNLAWLVEQGDKSVKLALIDTGVDWRHPDLGPNIWQNLGEDADGDGEVIRPSTPEDPYSAWEFDGEYDEIYGDDIDGLHGSDGDSYIDNVVGIRIHHWSEDPTLPLWDPNHAHCAPGVDVYGDDRYGEQGSHGTQMASILGAAHNGFGCVGVCPELSIVPINAAWGIERDDDTMHGVGVSEMLEALDYAMVTQVDVINISLSYGSNQHPESTFLRERLLTAASEPHNIIICCSAGNKDTEGVRWPAAYDFVQTTAVVRHDLVKAEQSSYASYVDFSAPSGEKPVTGGNSNMSGDEYMAAAKFSDPEPFWPDELPPHEIVNGIEQDTGPEHTYKALDGDTSGGAAQLSGAFALLKAHYPNHTRDELIAEMVRGAVDVDPYQTDPDVVGKLGAGLINPYRSLTEWGGPREPGHVYWSGDVWVSGDYTVPPGARLIIAQGTTIHVANFDNERQGNPEKVEIQADHIMAFATEEDSIRFVAYGPDSEKFPVDLGVLRLGGLANSIVQMRYCRFEGLSTVEIDGPTDGSPAYIENCGFPQLGDDHPRTLEADDIRITDCEFGPGSRWTVVSHENLRIENSKFEGHPEVKELHPAVLITSDLAGDFEIENSIIRNHREGIRVAVSNSLLGDPVTLSLDLTNVLLEHEYEWGVQARGDIGINVVGGGFLNANELTLRGFMVGIATQGESEFRAELSSFTDCYYAALNHDDTDYMMHFGYYIAPDDPSNVGGLNTFVDNEGYNILNLHPAGTVYARNCWWGSPSGPPPKSNQGIVDALYPLDAPPNQPPPPDFMTMVEEPLLPFAVGRNFPNPFNPVTEFSITVPRGGGHVRAVVYNIHGREVRKLLDRPLSGGDHSVGFNGRDDAGRPLPSGMYLCRFNYLDREEIVKATLVK